MYSLVEATEEVTNGASERLLFMEKKAVQIIEMAQKKTTAMPGGDGGNSQTKRDSSTSSKLG